MLFIMPDSVGGPRTSKSDLAFSPRSISCTRRLVEIVLMQIYGKVVSGQPYTYLLVKQLYRLILSLISLTTKKDALGRSHVANEPRLRHLYSSYRNFTIGKTYTTFTNLSSYPEINDANGPLGHFLIRQELIRYNASLSWGEIFLALEKAESTFTSTTGSSFQVNDDQIPDIIGKIKFSGSWGNYVRRWNH